MNELGEALRALRGKRTQAELAERAGLHPSTWSRYERGVHRPGEDSWTRVLQALGVSRDEFEQARRLVRWGMERALAGENRSAVLRQVGKMFEGLAAALQNVVRSADAGAPRKAKDGSRRAPTR